MYTDEKTFTLFTVLLLGFSLSACGGNAKKTASETTAVSDTAAAEHLSYEDAKISYLGPEGTYTQEA